MQRKCKKWIDNEIIFIKNNYKKMTPDEMGQKLNRSRSSIGNILSRNKLVAYKDSELTIFMRHVRMPSNCLDCWFWVGYKDKDGYGHVTYKNKDYMAHRRSYILFIDNIPNKLTIDHLCRNRACINPFHLETVTMKENIHRGLGPAAINYKKEYCIHGHKFTKENTYYGINRRTCKKCQRYWEKEYLKRKNQSINQ